MTSSPRRFYAILALAAVVVASFLSPLASTKPDGLMRVATDKGFSATQTNHGFEHSPVAGYQVKGIGNVSASKAAAGFVGVLLTLGLGTLLFGALRRRGADSEPPRRNVAS
jgi:cobalt/nickel transport system permease protein